MSIRAVWARNITPPRFRTPNIISVMYGIQSHVLRDSVIDFFVAFGHPAAKYGYIKRVTMFNFADARSLAQEIFGLQG